MLSFFVTRPLSPDTAVSGGVQLRSATSPWMRFSWKTASVPSIETSSDVAGLRPATKEEGQKVIDVILNALSLDSAWNGSFVSVENYLKDAATRILGQEESLCLVLPKGNRLIAASLMDPTAEASSQLLSGPVVLAEYRNRGIGSQLLHASLVALRDRGMESVSGVTRANTVCARHVYTKFGGIGEPVQLPTSSEVLELKVQS